MVIYVCTVCGYEHNEDSDELPEGWVCPVCGAGKSLFNLKPGTDKSIGHSTSLLPHETEKEPEGEYLKNWERASDDTEGWMKDFHAMAESGKSIYEPMRTKLPVVSWNDILIKGAQLVPLPLAHDAVVSTQTVIGKSAAKPMALASAAMMAIGCQQYRMCGSGRCPVGITSQDPELRGRLDVDKSAERLANYLTGCTEELKTFARITGHTDVHALNTNDLFTTNSEISEHTNIKHA